MAELANAKKARISAKSNFMRSVNTLNHLIESEQVLHVVTPLEDENLFLPAPVVYKNLAKNSVINVA